MWDGPSYDAFQQAYQFRSGMALLERLKETASIKGKQTLDLGCGNGQLTSALAAETGSRVTGVDLDDSMLAVAKEKYSTANIEFCYGNIPQWLSKQDLAVDLIFSNATFHWFGSHQDIANVVADCHRLLVPEGFLALRFSLGENAFEIKRYLEQRLRDFMGDRQNSYLKQSELLHEKIRLLLEQGGFKLLYHEELRFFPFEDPQWEFDFMLKSQPIHQFFTDRSLQEFREFLATEWQKSKVRLSSHHGLYIAQKI